MLAQGSISFVTIPDQVWNETDGTTNSIFTIGFELTKVLSLSLSLADVVQPGNSTNQVTGVPRHGTNSLALVILVGSFVSTRSLKRSSEEPA